MNESEKRDWHGADAFGGAYTERVQEAVGVLNALQASAQRRHLRRRRINRLLLAFTVGTMALTMSAVVVTAVIGDNPLSLVVDAVVGTATGTYFGCKILPKP